jgi:hypothetical protein
MIERLFALSRRSALRLMAPLCKAELGKAMIVRRNRPLGMFDTFAATRAAQGEIVRKRELRENLAVLKRQAQPRTTRITPPPAADEASARLNKWFCLTETRLRSSSNSFSTLRSARLSDGRCL